MKAAKFALGMSLVVPLVAVAGIAEALADGSSYSIPTGGDNKRVGNAMLVKLGWSYKSLKGISLILVACDGSWVSTIIDGTMSFDEKEPPPLSSEVRIDPIDFLPPTDPEVTGSALLPKKASQLCKTAGKEPRNYVVPIAISSGKEPTGYSTGVVLGTAVRSGNVIELWIRRTEFEKKPVLDKDGNVMQIGGVDQIKRVATGKYTMTRQIMDCRARTASSYEWAEYDGVSSSPKSGSVPREKLKLENVIPGSVGEKTVDMVCMLYGPQG